MGERGLVVLDLCFFGVTGIWNAKDDGMQSGKLSS